MRNPQIIVLNGKQYDALTGKPVSSGVSDFVAEMPKKTEQFINKTIKPRFVDGFSSVVGSVPLIRPKGHIKAADNKRSIDKSKTLMRGPLKKPDLAPDGSFTPPIKKSNYITRPSGIIDRPIITSSIINSVRKTADSIQSSQFVNKINDLKDKVAQNMSFEPPIVDPHAKKINQIVNADDEVLKTISNSIRSDVKIVNKSKLIKLTQKLHVSITMFYVLSTVIVILLIGGIMAFSFRNDLNLAYADYRTGLSGNYPSYLPLGYKLKTFDFTKNGQSSSLNFEYQPNFDNSGIYLHIIEANTSLDNAGLVSLITNSSIGNQYQTFLANGLSVYYFQNRYEWINGGMIYTLQDQTGLTQSVILKIIASI